MTWATLEQQLAPLTVPMPLDLLYYVGPPYGSISERQVQEMRAAGLITQYVNRSFTPGTGKWAALQSYFAAGSTNQPAEPDRAPPVDYSSIPIYYADTYIDAIEKQLREYGEAGARAWLPQWFIDRENDPAKFERDFAAAGRVWGEPDRTPDAPIEDVDDEPRPTPPRGAPAATGAPPAPAAAAAVFKWGGLLFLLGKLLR